MVTHHQGIHDGRTQRHERSDGLERRYHPYALSHALPVSTLAVSSTTTLQKVDSRSTANPSSCAIFEFRSSPSARPKIMLPPGNPYSNPYVDQFAWKSPLLTNGGHNAGIVSQIQGKRTGAIRFRRAAVGQKISAPIIGCRMPNPIRALVAGMGRLAIRAQQ